MSTDTRTSKANETRARKVTEFRTSMVEYIKVNPGRTDWQIAYELSATLAAVRKGLEEDPKLVELVRAFQVAVPAKTLKFPKWVDNVPATQRDKLPKVGAENRMALLVMDAPNTGNPAFDADLLSLQQFDQQSIARFNPKKAKAHYEDLSIVHSRIITGVRELAEQNAVLRDRVKGKDAEIKTLVAAAGKQLALA